MTLGPLMVGIEGTVLTATEREMLAHPAVSGVVLFTRNYSDPEQLTALCDAIHGVRAPALLITVDQEGGAVQRFRTGFTRLPAPGALGPIYDHDPDRARRLARTTAWLMAAELRACGVDLSFAPVLDLGRGISHVIGQRAFHRDAAVVASLGHAWVRGMREAGMAAVGKHYPGHGSVAADSHVALPQDNRTLAEIAAADLVPFQRLAATGLPAMMTAHVVYPEVDDRPASFSTLWVRDILRRRIGFQGAVFSDDLGMEASASIGDMEQRIEAALNAGCDAALVCAHEQVAPVIEAVGTHPDPASAMRLARLHGRPVPDRATLLRSPEWAEAVAAVREYDPDPEDELEL